MFFGGSSGKPPSKITIPSDCPNALFATWIQDWYLDAAAKGIKSQFTLKKALNSLLAHSVKLKSGHDAKQLPGIGDSIAAKLDAELKKFQGGSGGVEIVSFQQQDLSTATIVLEEEKRKEIEKDIEQTVSKDTISTLSTITTIKASRKTKTIDGKPKKEYIPVLRGGSYAMLCALLKAEGCGTYSLSKGDIVRNGQAYCNVDMLEGGVYSALSGAIKTLTSKGLVLKEGTTQQPRFSLSDEGHALAIKLMVFEDPKYKPIKRPIVDTEDAQQNSGFLSLQSKPRRSQLSVAKWPLGSFHIHLLIDNRELKSRQERDFFASKLADSIREISPNSIVEQRALEIGDIAWIAKRKDGVNEEVEVVLDWVVERKRLDDFVSSIIDGRFMEQKYRLSHSGVNNMFYIIEKTHGGPNTGRVMTPDKLFAAMIQTEICEGFFVRHTTSLEDTIRFITGLHQDVIAAYSRHPLHFVANHPSPIDKDILWDLIREQESLTGHMLHFTYSSFASLNSKTGNMTGLDLFLKQLLCIKGMSADRVALVASHFPTPAALYEEYARQSDDQSRRRYFEQWRCEGALKSFGPKLSHKLYEVFWE